MCDIVALLPQSHCFKLKKDRLEWLLDDIKGNIACVFVLIFVARVKNIKLKKI